METCKSYIDETVFLRVSPIIQHCGHKIMHNQLTRNETLTSHHYALLPIKLFKIENLHNFIHADASMPRGLKLMLMLSNLNKKTQGLTIYGNTPNRALIELNIVSV